MICSRCGKKVKIYYYAFYNDNAEPKIMFKYQCCCCGLSKEEDMTEGLEHTLLKLPDKNDIMLAIEHIESNTKIIEMENGKMKYGVIQSRNFTVEANSEDEAMQKMSNRWGNISSLDIKNGIKLDTCTITVYPQEQELKRVIYGECEIVYCGKSVLKSGGSEKTFFSKFYDCDGNEVYIEPTWNVELPPEIKSEQISFSWTEGEIKIKTNARAGSKFKLKMSANDEKYGCYESEVEIKVCGLW